MNPNLKIKAIKPNDDGIEYSLDQMRSREFRIGLMVDNLPRFSALDTDKADTDRREYSLSRLLFCMAQAYYLDAMPADFDTWARAKRRTWLQSPEGERCTGGWDTEIYCVQQAGGEQFKGVFESVKKNTKTTFASILSRINAGVEKGFNPAALTDGGTFRYKDIPEFRRAITTVEAEEKKTKDAIAAANARELALTTEKGKFDEACLFMGKFIQDIMARSKTGKALKSALFGQKALEHALKVLATEAKAIPVEEVGTLLREAEAGIDNILRTGKAQVIEAEAPEGTVPALVVDNTKADPHKSVRDHAFQVYCEGGAISNNPHEKGTAEYSEWKDAYVSAVQADG